MSDLALKARANRIAALETLASREQRTERPARGRAFADLLRTMLDVFDAPRTQGV